VADYRAINRNFKAVEQRKKLASTFSAPASKFTPGGRSGVVSTPKPVAGAGTNFLDQMLRRYTVNVPKGAYAVARDTLTGGEAAYKPAPAWMKLLYGPTVPSDLLYNMATNEKFSDALAPIDFVGAGSLVRGAATVLSKAAKPLIPVATSKVGKAVASGTAAVGGFGAADPDNAMAMQVNPNVLKPLLNKGGVQGLLNLLNDAVNDVPTAAKEASKLIGRQDKTGRVRSIFSDINRNYDKRVLAAKTGVANTGNAIQDLWSTTPKIFREALLKTHYAATGSVSLNQKDMYKATSRLLSDLQAKYGDDVVSIENALLNPEGGVWTWGHFGDVAKGAPHGLDFGGWQEATANFARRASN